jgi:hypothetical protein
MRPQSSPRRIFVPYRRHDVLSKSRSYSRRTLLGSKVDCPPNRKFYPGALGSCAGTIRDYMPPPLPVGVNLPPVLAHPAFLPPPPLPVVSPVVPPPLPILTDSDTTDSESDSDLPVLSLVVPQGRRRSRTPSLSPEFGSPIRPAPVHSPEFPSRSRSTSPARPLSPDAWAPQDNDIVDDEEAYGWFGLRRSWFPQLKRE